MFCVFTGVLFSLYVLLLSRDSLSLALSVHLLSVGESVVYDSFTLLYLPISTMG